MHCGGLNPHADNLCLVAQAADLTQGNSLFLFIIIMKCSHISIVQEILDLPMKYWIVIIITVRIIMGQSVNPFVFITCFARNCAQEFTIDKLSVSTCVILEFNQLAYCLVFLLDNFLLQTWGANLSGEP